jgi:hypothetical protein
MYNSTNIFEDMVVFEGFYTSDIFTNSVFEFRLIWPKELQLEQACIL